MAILICVMNDGFLLSDNVKNSWFSFCIDYVSCGVNDDLLLVDNVKMVD